jgi:hypothetical protein
VIAQHITRQYDNHARPQRVQGTLHIRHTVITSQFITISSRHWPQVLVAACHKQTPLVTLV